MNRMPCKGNCSLCLSTERIPIDPSSLKPHILSADDVLDGFHCRNVGVNKFILEEARPFQEERLGTTYLFSYDGKVIAFATLMMAEIKRELMSDEDRLEIGKDCYPALQIGQLAVDVRYEGNGVGTYVLDWCIGFAIRTSDRIACRFIVLDAEKDAVGFYEKYGFSMLKRQDRRTHPTMYIDVLPALKK